MALAGATVWSEDSTKTSENAWTSASVSLAPTAGVAQIRFVFDSVDVHNGYKGWLIDDIKVSTGTGGSATPTPTSTMSPTPTSTVSATFTPTSSPTATSTGSPTATPTSSPTATATATVTPTATGTPSGGGSTYFLDNLEGNTSGWSASGLWHLADNTTCVSPGYASQSHAFYYGQDSKCNYDTGSATSALTSGVISGLPSGVTLSFSYWRQVEFYGNGSFDKTYVQVSYNGGLSWNAIWSEDSTKTSENAWTSASVTYADGGGPDSIRLRLRRCWQ